MDAAVDVLFWIGLERSVRGRHIGMPMMGSLDSES